MKILRFNDDRIGVLKGEDRVVDVSEVVSYRVEKGPQRVIEEVIEKFDTLRGGFERAASQTAAVQVATNGAACQEQHCGADHQEATSPYRPDARSRAVPGRAA